MILSESMPNLTDGKWVSMTDDEYLVLNVEKCVICSRGLSSKKALLNHNEECPLCCRDCGICFATLHEINQHDLEVDHEE